MYSSYKKAPILESVFKAEHLETYSFIQKETLPKVFHYKLYEVLTGIDICVEHIWKSAYVTNNTQSIHR